MTNETFFESFDQQQRFELPADLEIRIAELGGLEALEERFGLGPEELSQEVKFGKHSGTVLEMMVDPECPVGEKIEEAYQSGGIEAVQQKLDTLSDLAPEFVVKLSPNTVARAELKKK